MSADVWAMTVDGPVRVVARAVDNSSVQEK
jgi:hypothetical protein